MTLLKVTTRYINANFDPNMSVDVNDGFHGTGADLAVGISEESTDWTHELTNGDLPGPKAGRKWEQIIIKILLLLCYGLFFLLHTRTKSYFF